MAKKAKKDKLKSVAKGKGFVSTLGQYLKFGDFNPKEVVRGTLTWTETETNRGRTRQVVRTMADASNVLPQAYVNKAMELNPSAKAVRHQGKLYRITGSPRRGTSDYPFQQRKT